MPKIDRRRFLYACGAAIGAAAIGVHGMLEYHKRRASTQAESSTATPLPEDHEQSLVSGGRERTYLLHLPPDYDGRTPVSLAVVLHGGGGNVRSIERMTGFSFKADRERFIVVYPEGTGRLKDRFLT